MAENVRDEKPVCVLGATGYVGGRLVPLLLERGWKVRAVGRSMEKLSGRLWAGHENCEIVAADLLDTGSLDRVLKNCKAAYYLVHSMHARHRDYVSTDQRAAQATTDAAERAGLERIIYLGGLAPSDPHLSEHLKSRAEVGDILSSGRTPTTVLRAAIILGSGSASFELIRYLVDRLPIMFTPKWVRTEVQPISIRDVLGYLSGCIEHPETAGRAFDIGGPFIETYEGLFRIYQQEAGLPRRLIVPVPVLTTRLSSYWLGLVSPIPVALSRPLIHGLRNRVVCHEHAIREIIPLNLTDSRTAIRRALEKVEQQTVDTCWSDAGPLRAPEWATQGDAPYTGGKILGNAYRIRVKGCIEELWDNISAIGGDTGWYNAKALWSIRGWLDKFVGGVGLRRGRRNPTRIEVGDALDFWRVLDVSPPRRLLLLAEMKLPGEALLEFLVEEADTDQVDLTMTAKFLPRGLGGILYWYSVFPFHALVFKGMVRTIARKTSCTVMGRPCAVDVAPLSCRLPMGNNTQQDANLNCS